MYGEIVNYVQEFFNLMINRKKRQFLEDLHNGSYTYKTLTKCGFPLLLFP